jgi:hypothetical protein
VCTRIIDFSFFLIDALASNKRKILHEFLIPLLLPSIQIISFSRKFIELVSKEIFSGGGLSSFRLSLSVSHSLTRTLCVSWNSSAAIVSQLLIK